MRKICVRKIISLCMAICLLLGEAYVITGCGSRINAEIPELIEPAATTLSFRPAAKRRIGNVELLMGVVVPASYSCSAKSTITLASLEVGIGDYVREGQVIATADTSELDSRLAELDYSIEELKIQRACREEVSKQQLLRLGFEKKEYKENGDDKGASGVYNEIAIEKENLRYDLSVLDNDIDTAVKKRAELKKELEVLTYTASHDGFVSEIVSLEDGGVLAAGSDIAVVSDENELYIEVLGVSANEYDYAEYKNKWAFIAGERFELSECELTEEEHLKAEASGSYPNIRFRVDSDEIKAGETVPLYFVKGDYRECLAVGNDSIYREEDRTYVYVKGAGGELIKRMVVLGEGDRYYCEVKEGLSEGEKVFYENSAIVPITYESAMAGRADYIEELSTEYYEPAFTSFDIYLSRYNGVVEPESVVKEGEEVHSGDTLLSLSTVTGRAAAYEAQLAIDNLDEQHKENEKNYERQIKLLEKEIESVDYSGNILSDVYGAISMKGLENARGKIETSLYVCGYGLEAAAEVKTEYKSEEEAKAADTDRIQGETIQVNDTESKDSTSDNEKGGNESEDKKAEDENDKEFKDEKDIDDSEKISKDNKAVDTETVDKEIVNSETVNTETVNTETVDKEAVKASYRKNILECEKKILEIERKYENQTYKNQREKLVKSYKELSGAGGKDGLISIKALDNGIMGGIFSEVNGAIYKGSVAAITKRRSDDVLLVKMKSSIGNTALAGKSQANIGQKVEIYVTDNDISGTCVGQKQGAASQFYVRLDDSMLKAGNEEDKLEIRYHSREMKSVITVPSKAVYSETDSLTQEKKSFVWRLENDAPIKEYVVVYEEGSNTDETVVLSGVDEGDIVIFE